MIGKFFALFVPFVVKMKYSRLRPGVRRACDENKESPAAVLGHRLSVAVKAVVL